MAVGSGPDLQPHACSGRRNLAAGWRQEHLVEMRTLVRFIREVGTVADRPDPADRHSRRTGRELS